MNIEQIRTEIKYRTSRSGGKGGQNVNKLETKVEAVLDVPGSQAFTEVERATVQKKLAHRISDEGLLSAVNQTQRSQLANKVLAERKLIQLLQNALIPEKKRKATKVPARVVHARLEGKKRLSEKKADRRNLNSSSGNDDD